MDRFIMKTLAELGERKAIEYILSHIGHKNNSIVIGDDCAVIDFDDSYLLVSSDMIAQKTHIHPQMSFWQIGWFIVAVNLSDLAAKGGEPLGVLLSLGLPKELSVNDFKELIQGANACVRTYGTSIIGGDTKENPQMVLSGTVLGKIEKQCFLARSGAKTGDIIAVTGELGKAFAGLLSLKKNSSPIDAYSKDLFEPCPRLSAGRLLARSGKVHCCMDLSDGLSSSLFELKKHNNAGFIIDGNALPVSKKLRRIFTQKSNEDIFSSVLHMGGDYELLFTIGAKNFSSLQKQLQAISVPVTRIGTVTKTSGIYYKNKDNLTPMENRGYEHFKEQQFH